MRSRRRVVDGPGASRQGSVPHGALRWGLIAALLVFLVPAAAEACSCAPHWMIAQGELSDPETVIFVGVAEAYAPGSWQGGFLSERVVRMRPFFFLRGSWPARPVEVGGGWGDCDASLEPGWTYLITASRTDEGRLTTGRCSLTGSLVGLGLSFGFWAVLVLIAAAMVRGLWRLQGWLRRRPRLPRARAAKPPTIFLGTSAALTLLAALLVVLAPRLAAPATYTVCNRLAGEPLEQVEAQSLIDSQAQSVTVLGRLEPGECGTAKLASSAPVSLGFTYRHQGTAFTVHPPELAHVPPGRSVYSVVTGRGTSQSGESYAEEPDPRTLTLAAFIFACLTGAALCLLLSTWAVLGRLVRWRRASAATPSG